MAEIRTITDWRMHSPLLGAYDKLLGALGTEEFGSTVRDYILLATAGAHRLYLFEAQGRDQSSLQYHFCEPGLTRLLPAYTDRYLRLDPVCDAYGAAPSDGDMALLRIRPADIPSTGFRRQFFEEPGIVERVSVIQRGRGEWRVINVARHSQNGCFSDEELSVLVGIASLALPMLPFNRQPQVATSQLTVSQLEDRFAARFDDLTLRERQVCARAAIGMTVEATAIDLAIAKTSVLTYRRRAYQRLQVSSPFELCSLVTH